MGDIVERLKAKIGELEYNLKTGHEPTRALDNLPLLRDALAEIDRLNGQTLNLAAEAVTLQARLAALEEAAQTALPVLEDLGLAAEGSLIPEAHRAAARIRAALSGSPAPRDDLREALIREAIPWVQHWLETSFYSEGHWGNADFTAWLAKARAWLEAHSAPKEEA